MSHALLTEYRKGIDAYMDTVLPPENTEPSVIHRAMRHSVFSGGKRLRPIIVLAVGEIFDVNRDRLLPAACGLELLHNFSLVHDDLPSMDNDDYRRGKPTCHKKFGEPVAILAGDALLTLAFESIAESGNCLLVKDTAKAAGSLGMAGGQVMDILHQNKKVPAPLRENINRKKTGMLFEICFAAPLYFANATKAEDRKQIGLVAEKFGMAFQIRDDLEDNEGPAKKLQIQLNEIRMKMLRDIQYFGTRGELLREIIEKLYGKQDGENNGEDL